MPIEVQVRAAERRLARVPEDQRRPRVPAANWPAGTRWCAGCQSMIPLWYANGSRCRACASRASHRAMVRKTYGLEDGEYEALLEAQGHRCAICGRRAGKVRFAVDHDHSTGRPRGLLCPGSEHGCNKGLGFFNDDADLLQRAADYLRNPPYERLRSSAPRPR
jgi:hypothetical protein